MVLQETMLVHIISKGRIKKATQTPRGMIQSGKVLDHEPFNRDIVEMQIFHGPRFHKSNVTVIMRPLNF